MWVVNIPNENASVQLSSDQPHDGKQSLKLHYHFLGTGSFQYLGIPIPVKIQAPVHKLHYWLKGDNSKCCYGLQLTDAGGETHQYRSLSSGTGQGGVVDFSGWKESSSTSTLPHETWGGDKNGKLDHPISVFILTVGQPVEKAGGKEKLLAAEGDLYFDSLSVDSDRSVVETLGCQISVVSPHVLLRREGRHARHAGGRRLPEPDREMLEARRRVRLRFHRRHGGPGCQRQRPFVFPADAYPHGPVTVPSVARSAAVKDNCYLQLYNKGGISWNEGMPKDPPPAAKDMALIFADDFKGPLSIGPDAKATYYDHKPPNGWQDFSTLRFTSFDKPNNPFSQVDTYLRIRASERRKFRPDLLGEERRQRRQGHAALLLRVPLRRSQRHRHLAGLLAADRHPQRSQVQAPATSWTSLRPTAAKAPASPTPTTAT